MCVTLPLSSVYPFGCVFSAVWPVLCWGRVKQSIGSVSQTRSLPFVQPSISLLVWYTSVCWPWYAGDTLVLWKLLFLDMQGIVVCLRQETLRKGLCVWRVESWPFRMSPVSDLTRWHPLGNLSKTDETLPGVTVLCLLSVWYVKHWRVCDYLPSAKFKVLVAPSFFHLKASGRHWPTNTLNRAWFMEVNLYFVYLDILFARIKYIGVRKIFCNIHCFKDEVSWLLTVVYVKSFSTDCELNIEEDLLSL